MKERIQAELILIWKEFPDAVYQEEGSWVCLPSYLLPGGWNRAATDVAFQVIDGYPAADAVRVLRSFGDTVRRGYSRQLHGPGLQSTPIWTEMGLLFVGADCMETFGGLVEGLQSSSVGKWICRQVPRGSLA